MAKLLDKDSSASESNQLADNKKEDAKVSQQKEEHKVCNLLLCAKCCCKPKPGYHEISPIEDFLIYATKHLQSADFNKYSI